LLVTLAAVLGVAALVAPGRAEAFCGFYVSGGTTKLYNNATQVVLMRDGLRTIQSMQNSYQGPPEDFAMVVPVPVVLKKEDVKTLPAAVFAKVDVLDAPRLVEYWEQDPCPRPLPSYKSSVKYDAAPRSAMGKGSGAAPPPAAFVEVKARFSVGEYDVIILESNDAATLDAWLRERKYQIPDGAQTVLAPYIDQGMYFFVAKVDVKKVKFEAGRAALSPLRFHYDDKKFFLPVRLGMLNANGPQDLIVHILARNQRYEVANLPNTTIPTNIDVKDGVRRSFGAFYNALFDATQKKHPRAVVTEYSWSASSCDPCPGPTLDGGDLLGLGADVLPGQVAGGFTLTRLHARYTKEELTEDLVFQVAPPIIGGREVYVDRNEIETGTKPSSVNNFQGRYAIRHLWTGPIACAHPERGVWGGPPHGRGEEPPWAARDLAFAPRKGVELQNVVRSDVPEVDIKAKSTTKGALKRGRKGAKK